MSEENTCLLKIKAREQAQERVALERMAQERVAPERMAPERVAQERVVPERVAEKKVDRSLMLRPVGGDAADSKAYTLYISERNHKTNRRRCSIFERLFGRKKHKPAEVPHPSEYKLATASPHMSETLRRWFSWSNDKK